MCNPNPLSCHLNQRADHLLFWSRREESCFLVTIEDHHLSSPTKPNQHFQPLLVPLFPTSLPVHLTGPISSHRLGLMSGRTGVQSILGHQNFLGDLGPVTPFSVQLTFVVVSLWEKIWGWGSIYLLNLFAVHLPTRYTHPFENFKINKSISLKKLLGKLGNCLK